MFDVIAQQPIRGEHDRVVFADGIAFLSSLESIVPGFWWIVDRRHGDVSAAAIGAADAVGNDVIEIGGPEEIIARA